MYGLSDDLHGDLKHVVERKAESKLRVYCQICVSSLKGKIPQTWEFRELANFPSWAGLIRFLSSPQFSCQ